MCFINISKAPKIPKPAPTIEAEKEKTPEESNDNYLTSTDDRKRQLKAQGIASTQLTNLGGGLSTGLKKKLGE